MMVSQWYLWVEPHQLFRQFTIYVEETKSAITLYQHVIQTLEHVTIAIMVMTEDGFIKCAGITAMCVELMDCVFVMISKNGEWVTVLPDTKYQYFD